MIDKSEWVWMPHAGHFICGHLCRFKLNTRVGRWIVSTVGEYDPGKAVRKITGQAGFSEIGCGRLYETMVFPASKSDNPCCPWTIESGVNIDFAGYNDPGLAYEGHLAMCDKWCRIDELPKKEEEHDLP